MWGGSRSIREEGRLRTASKPNPFQGSFTKAGFVSWVVIPMPRASCRDMKTIKSR